MHLNKLHTIGFLLLLSINLFSYAPKKDVLENSNKTKINSSKLFSKTLKKTLNTTCGNNPVTLINQQTATTIGAGTSKIPSISSLNIPSGDERAVFVLVSFERSHCQSGDNCSSFNSSGIGLGDNFAAPNFLSNSYQITGRFSGSGGFVDYKNPLTSPDGDLRFGFQYGAAGSNINATYLSRESYFIAIYESDINTILGGSASGTINITLPDVVAPLDAADEAIMYAFVFEHVEQTNFGIVRSGVNTSLDNITDADGSLNGNFAITANNLDNGQEPDEAQDGLLVLGVSGLGASNTGGFDNVSGYSKIAEHILNNPSGNYTTYNEGDGFSAAVFFRNGLSSGMIDAVSIRSSAPYSLAANGGMLFAFTIESCYAEEDCTNGSDDDGDGWIDCADDECQPTIATLNSTAPNCSNTTGGQIIITASGTASLSYSITNEPSWQSSSIFSNLGVGQYTIRVRNGNGCEKTYATTVTLDVDTCLEICDNGIDDDGDGKIDCDDDDCVNVGTTHAISQ